MIDPGLKTISVRRQTEALELPRSTYYYQAKPLSTFNIRLMHRIDEIYTESPDYGSRMICKILRREYSNKNINRKRIQRLMRIMGKQALYPKRNLSKPGKGSEHKIYPYLLRNKKIDHPNQVWSTDITYIRLKHGFVYLVAIMDWYSRRILSWELSTSMDSSFCTSTLDRAIRQYGAPEIFNSDQGSQFTSKDFRDRLEKRSVKISMDGKGRAIDNIVIERFWRTIKYGEVYLKEYESPLEAVDGISRFIEKYNSRRPHSSLEDRTPDEAYGLAG